MRVLIVSDIHANWAALRSIRESVDHVLFLGDVVNYGPKPRECVEWVDRNASLTVSGNHDRAVSKGWEPRCSAPYQRAATHIKEVHRKLLAPSHLGYLASLPLRVSIHLGRVFFEMAHSSPYDPLYGSYSEHDLLELLPLLQADVLVVGHSHTPYVVRVGKKLLINPGSVGQPRDGDPRASYAIWEDGDAQIRRIEYPVSETVREVKQMPIPNDVRNLLVQNLETGKGATLEFAVQS